MIQAKNAALKEAGAIVPDSFEAFEGAIKVTYEKLMADGILVPRPDIPAPDVPLDLEAAKKAGKVHSCLHFCFSHCYVCQHCVSREQSHGSHSGIWQFLSWKVTMLQVRVPTNVVSSICDDRGEEPTYNGVNMSTLITGDYGVGDVISLLWFKRALPKYATRFIDMCVMLCADHGPCVSGKNLSTVYATRSDHGDKMEESDWCESSAAQHNTTISQAFMMSLCRRSQLHRDI